MSNNTLDTTVLVKAIFPPRRRKSDLIYGEQLRLHTIVKSMLRRVENKESSINIPSVAIIEVAAVGARLTAKYERGIQASDFVKEHASILYDTDLMDEAVEIAAKTRISGFDSIFIACAKITDSTLITDDKGMYDSALKVRVKARLLRNIEQI